MSNQNVPGLMPHIAHVWAYLSVDQDGDEAVCGFLYAGKWIAMVAADEKRVESLRPIAAEIVAETGKIVRLVKFTERIDQEVLRP